jgi:D-aminopeptidase
MSIRACLWLLPLIAAAPLVAQDGPARPRARDLGIPFDGTPGPLNAITDVAGIEVGHTTLIAGSGRMAVGKGPVRTGVTAILPRGKASTEPVFGGWFAMNGNGEMTGTAWLSESGLLYGPVMITNTHSIGAVHEGVVAWSVERNSDLAFSLPVVAETYDGFLNDINGFHVKPEHARSAIETARPGAVPEGSVGGGTGMVCNGFKGGIGTSSRKLPTNQGGYTVGVLVQCNYGGPGQLRIAGVTVGREMPGYGICAAGAPPSFPMLRGLPACSPAGAPPTEELDDRGSIIIVVATDAPLLSHQLDRIARRAALGLGRTGSLAGNESGDLFIAFSTATTGTAGDAREAEIKMLVNDRLNPLFLATVQATEEAITNAMIAAETMTGADDVRVHGLPHDKVVEVLKKYGRIQE